jgi:hypothetical protein
MMKKTALALILAAVFFAGLGVNSFPVVRVAEANPFEAPAWAIQSPKTNTTYNTDSFNLSFRVASIFNYDYYYSLDAPISEVFLGGTPNQGKTLVNATLISETPGEGVSKIKTFQYSSELPSLSDGQHNLTLYYGYTDNFSFRRELASATIIFYIDPSALKITDFSIENTDLGDRLLSFNVDKTTSWVGYSLDNQANVTVNGDVVLRNMSAGSHSVTVYAEDTAGNKGASETLYFTVEEAESLEELAFLEEIESSRVTLVLASTGAVSAVAVCLLVYFKKRKH